MVRGGGGKRLGGWEAGMGYAEEEKEECDALGALVMHCTAVE